MEGDRNMNSKISRMIHRLENREERLSSKVAVECDKIEKQIAELIKLDEEIEEGKSEVTDLRNALKSLDSKENTDIIVFYVDFRSGCSRNFNKKWTMSPKELPSEIIEFLRKLINDELAQAETRLAELEKSI